MKQKLLTVLSALVLVLAAGLAVYINSSLDDTMSTINFIAGRYKGSGVFVDYDNSIGVKTADDIGYWYKKGNWYIKYGKLQLEFTPKMLEDPEYIKGIAAIGLDARGSISDGSLRWFWCDEELEVWVPN